MKDDFLFPNESILMRGAAYQISVGGLGRKAGKLILTNQRLIFKASKLSSGSKFDEISLKAISNLQNYFCFVFLRNAMKICTKSEEYIYLVSLGKCGKWKRKINDARLFI